MSWFINPPFEIAIVGDEFAAKRKEFDPQFLPNVFLSRGKNEGVLSLLEGKLIKYQTTIYVCRNKSCQLPVIDVKDALKQLNN